MGEQAGDIVEPDVESGIVILLPGRETESKRGAEEERCLGGIGRSTGRIECQDLGEFRHDEFLLEGMELKSKRDFLTGQEVADDDEMGLTLNALRLFFYKKMRSGWSTGGGLWWGGAHCLQQKRQ
ncbi:unnamed protein product [Calypogeia fissa]